MMFFDDKRRELSVKHETYVAERTAREPRFADERKVASAELALGESLVRRRVDRDVSLARLSELTGIPETRLDDIEAGDALTLHEDLWLSHALELDLAIRAGFSVSATPASGQDQTEKPTTLASRSSRSPKAATA